MVHGREEGRGREGEKEEGRREGGEGAGKRTGSGTPHALQALRKLLMFSICLKACRQSCSRGRREGGGGSSDVVSHAHVWRDGESYPHTW